MSRKQGLSIAQVAGKMELKGESTRRWVSAFEEVTGRTFRASADDARQVPRDVVEVLIAAKHLLDSGRVSSRSGALQTVLAEREDRSASVSVEQPQPDISFLVERLDKHEALLKGVAHQFELQGSTMPAAIAMEFRRLLNEFLDDLQRTASQSAQSSVSAGVETAVAGFKTRLMEHARKAERRYETAIAEAAQQVTQAGDNIQARSERIEKAESVILQIAQRAENSLASYRSQLEAIIGAIQNRSLKQLLPLSIAGILGIGTGAGITMLVFTYGWQWTGILLLGITVFVPLMLWLVLAIWFRYFY